MSFLQLRALSKAFGPECAVNSVALDLAAGARMAIVGPSGCGKTTLLRLIAGFEQPDSGTVTLDGATLASRAESVPAHRRRIGYLPQDGALFPHLSVERNIAFGLAERGVQREKRIAALMDLVALDSALLRRWPHELSGGQQQRVALARALALQPRLMLLDEPFSALDTGLRAATRKAVTQVLAAANVAAILVTHDQAEALSFSDQLGVMRGGRLVQVGQPMDLYLHPADEATAQFLGEAIILAAQVADGWADSALGRVPVDDGRQHGSGRIMIRPEQLRLLPNTEDRGCPGIVAEIDFTGSTAMVTVQIASDAGSQISVVLRTSSRQLPKVGDPVRLGVIDCAHILRDAIALD